MKEKRVSSKGLVQEEGESGRHPGNEEGSGAAAAVGDAATSSMDERP